MIEIPEAIELSKQICENISGKEIINVTAATSPHKFAWYHGEPAGYHDLLSGKLLGAAKGVGSMVEVTAGDTVLLFSEGVSLRFHGTGEKRPEKHQLLVEFEDLSALSASVQMYGGLFCFKAGDFVNKYYNIAKEKPSPISEQFNEAYFDSIISAPENAGLSAKALLATEQRIPGLGNGVLQDVLFNGTIHPKRKVRSLSDSDREKLYKSLKNTLAHMTFKGGRDTERDLFGCCGGYKSVLSKNTVGKPCPVCGELVKKEAYLGGSIYFCPGCQKV